MSPIYTASTRPVSEYQGYTVRPHFKKLKKKERKRRKRKKDTNKKAIDPLKLDLQTIGICRVVTETEPVVTGTEPGSTLKLNFQTVGIHHVVTGTEPVSTAGATHALYC